MIALIVLIFSGRDGPGTGDLEREVHALRSEVSALKKSVEAQTREIELLQQKLDKPQGAAGATKDNIEQAANIHLDEPDRMREARSKLEADFQRLFKNAEQQHQVLAYDFQSAKERITRSPDFEELFRIRYWSGKNPRVIIPWLIESLENRALVGLENSADLIIDERIATGDLRFYGHGWVSQDDLFTVAGRASWLLKAVTGEDFGSVKPDSTSEELSKIGQRWRTWWDRCAE